MKGSFDDEHGIAWIANLLNRIVVQETNFSVGCFRHLFQTQMESVAEISPKYSYVSAKSAMNRPHLPGARECKG